MLTTEKVFFYILLYEGARLSIFDYIIKEAKWHFWF